MGKIRSEPLWYDHAEGTNFHYCGSCQFAGGEWDVWLDQGNGNHDPDWEFFVRGKPGEAHATDEMFSSYIPSDYQNGTYSMHGIEAKPIVNKFFEED